MSDKNNVLSLIAKCEYAEVREGHRSKATFRLGESAMEMVKLSVHAPEVAALEIGESYLISIAKAPEKEPEAKGGGKKDPA